MISPSFALSWLFKVVISFSRLSISSSSFLTSLGYGLGGEGEGEGEVRQNKKLQIPQAIQFKYSLLVQSREQARDSDSSFIIFDPSVDSKTHLT